MKARGADAVFDYHDPSCAAQIKAYANNSLRYILDTISTSSSYAICADAFPNENESTEKLSLVSLHPLDGWPRKDVGAKPILAYTTFGEAFSKNRMDFPTIKEHYDFGVGFWKLNERLVAEGKIVPHPVTLGKGGLGGVPAG